MSESAPNFDDFNGLSSYTTDAVTTASTSSPSRDFTPTQAWLMAQLTVLVCLLSILVPCTIAIVIVKCREHGHCYCFETFLDFVRRGCCPQRQAAVEARRRGNSSDITHQIFFRSDPRDRGRIAMYNGENVIIPYDVAIISIGNGDDSAYSAPPPPYEIALNMQSPPKR